MSAYFDLTDSPITNLTKLQKIENDVFQEICVMLTMYHTLSPIQKEILDENIVKSKMASKCIQEQIRKAISDIDDQIHQMKISK